MEFLGIWEQVHNPDFNHGGFAAIKSRAGFKNPDFNPIEFDGIGRQAKGQGLLMGMGILPLEGHLP